MPEIKNATIEKPKTPPVYEYLPPTPEMRTDLELLQEETATAKVIRKFSAQPLVPIGCMCTVAALSYGMYQMKTGNKQLSQRMMRLRVIAQGFTIVACLAGLFHTAKTKRQPSLPAVSEK